MLSSPLLAREKTDVLVMRNGDRLTCEIKRLDSDVLYIRLDYVLGTISVNWSKVDHVESKQLFLVKTQDSSVYSGALSHGVIHQRAARQNRGFGTFLEEG
jgi:hypothetical protein